MAVIDRIGSKFGLLTVVSFNRSEKVYPPSGKKPYTKRFYNCLCDCGNSVSVLINSLTSGNTSSCGCLRSAMLTEKAEDLSNQKFNRLTAISKVHGKGSFWNCICDCGNSLTTKAESLKSGNTKSCGCLQKEISSETFIRYNKDYRASMGRDPKVPMQEDNELQRSLMGPLRTKIFGRDSYTCVYCSKISGKLNAHHIKTWAMYPELRFVEENLVTLCIECHCKVHKENFNIPPDPYMSIILEGYTKVIDHYNGPERSTPINGLF